MLDLETAEKEELKEEVLENVDLEIEGEIDRE